VADVAFHPEAQAEYDVALAWYQARSVRTAARFEAEADRILGLIGSSPELFPEYDDQHRFAVLRRFPYTIVYQMHPDRVLVVAFAYSGRQPGYWQGRA
jgi:hypothetical protein